ncbi:hypothetical protein KYTH67_11180 [Helicobacter pylori]
MQNNIGSPQMVCKVLGRLERMRVPLPAASMMTESIKILKLILGNFNMPYLIIWLHFIKDLRLEFCVFSFF